MPNSDAYLQFRRNTTMKLYFLRDTKKVRGFPDLLSIWSIENGRIWGEQREWGLEFNPKVDIQSQIETAWRVQVGSCDLFESPYRLNQFHGRIARPIFTRYCNPLVLTAEPEAFEIERISALRQLEILYRMLGDICEVAEPDQNLTTFGHKIRNLLILASTEAEAQWKGVLTANAYTKTKNLNIYDYIKLCKPMRLSGYAVKFIEFPKLNPLTPFIEWNSESQLTWYQAYNNVKHDREKCFSQATLERSLSAFSACAVMYVAQFGFPLGALKDRIVINVPEFEPNELYVGNVGFEGERAITRLNINFA